MGSYGIVLLFFVHMELTNFQGGKFIPLSFVSCEQCYKQSLMAAVELYFNKNNYVTITFSYHKSLSANWIFFASPLSIGGFLAALGDSEFTLGGSNPKVQTCHKWCEQLPNQP